MPGFLIKIFRVVLFSHDVAVPDDQNRMDLIIDLYQTDDLIIQILSYLNIHSHLTWITFPPILCRIIVALVIACFNEFPGRESFWLSQILVAGGQGYGSKYDQRNVKCSYHYTFWVLIHSSYNHVSYFAIPQRKTSLEIIVLEFLVLSVSP